MKKSNYTKYYRVFMHDTAITEISTIDFKPVNPSYVLKAGTVADLTDSLCVIPVNPYMLLADDLMFYGYLTRARAMQQAKAGAQRYINKLIGQGGVGSQQLMQYRMDHYEDLNINLLEANIQKVKRNTI